MDTGAWYNIEEVCMRLFGKVSKATVLDFENAWDKEYFFKDGELDKTKKMFKDARNKHAKMISMNARNIGDLIVKKRYKNEVRKKEPASVKFIRDEI